MGYTLVVGNKNYSSWSLRAYLALAQTHEPFQEVVIPLDQPDSKARIRAQSEAGRVPVLIDGGLRIWDSLAIAEYVAERHPQVRLWPAEATARAVARSAVAEMHAGFAALRQHMPMDLRSSHPGRGIDGPGVRDDISRITGLWCQLRERFGGMGPFLFGSFSIADAVYAPVASRFRTYGVELDATCAAYVDAIYAVPAFRTWLEAARAEPWTIPAA